MRLFFAVVETHTLVVYSIMLLLWGILAPVKGPVTAGSLAFLAVVVVLSTTVNKTKATALGLSRKAQTRYNLGLATYYVVLGAAVSVARQWWWLAALVLVAWAIRLVVTLRQSSQSAAQSDMEVRELQYRVASDGKSDFGRFPITPTAQLIYRPLVRSWMWVVAGYASVGLVMWAAIVLWNIEGQLFSIVYVMVTLLTLGALMDSYRTSFKEFVTLGGSRQQWVRAVTAASVIGAAAGAILELVVWTSQGTITGMIFGMGALIPVLGVSWELLSRKTIVWTMCMAVTAGVTFVLTVMEVLPQWSFAACAGVLYLVWAALLPMYARNADPYSGGVLQWFGVNTS
ncbi:hypothetical protein HMPREF2559_10955 [Corynebacterium sp. HMSC072G08]|uniref:hypothetical protein n=1 Tax=Corynebacterium sp. HMSC072G08 TaxID=1715039 RepID=UPI0008A10896|nr:hypothetical protein [Corynebacterium sp. HMSC072G08]OFN43043.1 hypothetical protein HMPREF2559_10955 [Corynebacterium sp. HMSC072G08]